MVLTDTELDSLINLRHGNPHQLLGMHPLGDRSGVVVRVFWPGARAVKAVPVHEPTRPTIALERIHEAGLFEGVAPGESRVYACDLVVTFPDGRQLRTRDAYSFLPTLEADDLHRFGEGRELRLYEKLGAHLRELDGVAGTAFAVWAPNARRVSVVGSFNEWDGRRHAMRMLGGSGVWEIFVPGVGEGALYKFEVVGQDGVLRLKTDPFGAFFEVPPKQAAVVWDTRKHAWNDDAWMAARRERNPLDRPLSIYEIHAGSWRKKAVGESPGYRELAGPLVDYLREMGFTHVEFLPLAEHAYYPSWGYQITGFYAPTSRYGTPDDLQYLVDTLHDAGIGVLLDWVPAHFPRDEWALARFDGTALYEHADPRRGAHQDWGTLIFNYGRHEVRNFLTANALYWCERFHLDGLRVDAVASMLYLDYSRREGEWLPNEQGGRENLEAIAFLREFNHLVHTRHPGVMTVAEESTAWPQVTRPPEHGGLGFSFKWNMGWMHDTLGYFQRDPIHRRHHQHELTFAMLYHYNENFILPLSHDEVVHGKGSLRRRMPGDDWQAFANLRCLLAYQWLFPGKQLLFMGGEFGQSAEWNENAEVDWALLHAGPYHAGVRRLVQDLNRLYRAQPAFWEADFDPVGFAWVDASDQANSVLSFLRRPRTEGATFLVVLNLTPVPRTGYRLGVPRDGFWREALNTDADIYGGNNQGNQGGLRAESVPSHGHGQSLLLTLPPLSVVAFESE